MAIFKQSAISLFALTFVSISQICAMEATQDSEENIELVEEATCFVCCDDYKQSGKMRVRTTCCKTELCHVCADKIFREGYQYVDEWGIASPRLHTCAFCRTKMNIENFQSMFFDARQRDLSKSLLSSELEIENITPYVDYVARHHGSNWELSNTIRYLLEKFRPSLAAEILKRGLKKAGTSIEKIKFVNGNSALLLSAIEWNCNRFRDSSTDVIEVILKASGEKVWDLITMKNKLGDSILSEASSDGWKIIVQLILNAAGDRAGELLNIKEKNGKTAFEEATPGMKEIMLPYLKRE